MAPIGKIYGYAPNSKVSRTLIAAKINGLELEHVAINTSKGEHQTPEFLAKFPMGKIPAFEGSDGFLLTESKAIAKYVAGLSDNSKLLGSDAKSGALVEQWISWADDEIFNPFIQIFLLCNGMLPYNKAAETKSWESLKRSLAYLEAYLNKATYLVGHRLTLADITVAANLRMSYRLAIGAEVRASYPNVQRYYETISNQPSVSEYLTAEGFLAENAKFTPPKKEAAPKAAAAPKEAKKAAPKKKDDDEEDEPSAAAEEPKVAHPCASLPASKQNMDETKRQYSNLDTPDFLKWFYENFDSEGYSLWRVDFKYNEELTQPFMSANQITGLFTRLEASRKYIMGSAAVFGEANKSAIAGVFLVRGQDPEACFSVAPDWESYKATPIDLKDAKQKEFFENTLSWVGTLEDGKPLLDNYAKIFK